MRPLGAERRRTAQRMRNLSSRIGRYVTCYRELASGVRPDSLEKIIDYCLDRPIILNQSRFEILRLGELLQSRAPMRSLEIGTSFGGTLYFLFALSPPGAKVISVDLPSGPFGGGYPLRKVPLYRKFPIAGQRLSLIRANSHAPETKERVLRILGGELLDYLFIDADHTYRGVELDFQMYSPLVRSGGVVAFHDIVTHKQGSACDVARFWGEVKQRYDHLEFVDAPPNSGLPLTIHGDQMDTSGIGVVFSP